MCARATARVNGYCNQVLRATIDDELFHGPDFRVTVGPAAGGSGWGPWRGSFNARITCSRSPILEVTSVQVCPNSLFPRVWTTLPAGWAEPEKPAIGIYGAIEPSSDAAGGQGIIVGPGYISWAYGRNGYAILVTYVNGWPHTALSAAVEAGAVSLPVYDCTGWGITNYYGTTGATGILKDSGQQESAAVASTSVTAGPGTLTLSSGLNYPHPAGTIITTLPSSIEQACILFASAEALTRGATTTTIHDIGGHAQNTGGDVLSLVTEAELLIHPFRRTILGVLMARGPGCARRRMRYRARLAIAQQGRNSRGMPAAHSGSVPGTAQKAQKPVKAQRALSSCGWYK